MTMRRVLLRADASHAIGYGHIGRLFALHEELVYREREVKLVVGPPLDDGAEIAKLRGWLHDRRVDDAEIKAWTPPDVLEALARCGSDAVIVIDGRPLALALVPHLKNRPHQRIVVIDDEGALPLRVHAVVNQNYHAPTLAASYHATRRLLGRRYALLRKGIRRLTRGSCRPAHGAARLRVVVTFGGSDPVGATARVLGLLPADRPLDLVVVEGPAFEDPDGDIPRLAARLRDAGHLVDIQRAPADPGSLFATADAAISAAGGTLGELAYLGCPTLGLAIVPDQVATAAAQARDGLIASGHVLHRLDDAALTAELSRFLTDDAWRRDLRASALATIDGDGAARIVAEALS